MVTKERCGQFAHISTGCRRCVGAYRNGNALMGEPPFSVESRFSIFCWLFSAYRLSGCARRINLARESTDDLDEDLSTVGQASL